ncbi:type II toxin-antitoxin system death-on-curing family toxin [Gluconobacter cerinus]
MALSPEFFIYMNRQLTSLHGGLHGVRDRSALESAVARFSNMLAYADEPDVVQASVAMAEGIVRNHPFLDGNKRTAVAALHVALEMNGYQLEAPVMEQVCMVEALAARAASSESFRDWVAMRSSRRELHHVLAQRDAGNPDYTGEAPNALRRAGQGTFEGQPEGPDDDNEPQAPSPFRP